MNRRRIVSVAIGLVGLIVSFLAAFPALSAILGTGSLESVKSLSRGSRILAVASAVGKLYASIDGQLSFCTAALISPSYIITTAH